MAVFPMEKFAAQAPGPIVLRVINVEAQVVVISQAPQAPQSALLAT